MSSDTHNQKHFKGCKNLRILCARPLHDVRIVPEGALLILLMVVQIGRSSAAHIYHIAVMLIL